MHIKQLKPFAPLTGYILAPVFVFLTTVAVAGLQSLLMHLTHTTQVRPYGIAFIVAIAAVTAIGGRTPGYFTLALSLASVGGFLSRHTSAGASTDPRNIAELSLIALVGFIVIFGVDALKRNAELLAEARVQAARETLLNRIGAKLRDVANAEEIQNETARELGIALDAQRCYFVIYDQSAGAVHISGDWHAEGLESIAGDFSVEDLGEDFKKIFAMKDPLIFQDIARESFSEKTKALFAQSKIISAASIPLIVEKELIAVLTVACDHPRVWTDEEITFVTAVARQTYVSIEAARVRMRERTTASVLQEALLPGTPSGIPGLDIAAHYRPALSEASVGGDFFDIFEIDEDRFALVVGDVSGKGLAAAVQVAVVRNMLRCLLYTKGSPYAAVSSLNSVLTKHQLLTGFTTLFVALYHATTGLLTYVSCGHEPALIHRNGDGVEQLDNTGLPLGVTEEFDFEERSANLNSHDALVIFTDGVTDSGSSTTEFLKVDGLCKILQQRDPGDKATSLVNRIMGDVENRTRGQIRDDTCMIVAVR